MSPIRPKGTYTVLPLPCVQREARKILTGEQLKAAIAIAKKLRNYPTDSTLDIGPCGDGMELRIQDGTIGAQGWLRATFWVDKPSRLIYVVDIFWKTTNKITLADIERTNHRIRQLKSQLSQGHRPWG